MMYCPICNEELQPGKVCTCGWDPSCDYENYLSLVPAPTGLLTVGVQRKAFWNQRLEDQKKADEARFEQLKQTYEAKITALESQKKNYENRLKTNENVIQTMESQQKSSEAAIQKLKSDNEAKTARIRELESQKKTLEDWKKNSEAQIDTLTTQIKNLQAGNVSTSSVVPVRDNNAAQTTKSEENPAPASKLSVSPKSSNNVKVGEEIIFGKYRQGKSRFSGKTGIQWRVMAKEGSRALLISKYCLDAKPYNTERKDVTWETCSLRSWLNHDFYDAAFSAEEKRSILTTTVTADANPRYGTNPGSDTKDKLFLLSIPEAEKYFASDNDRKCVPTAYALAQGAFVSDKNKTAEGEACCWWWLRSPGFGLSDAAYVYDGGSVLSLGDKVNYGYVCVRPALWINL